MNVFRNAALAAAALAAFPALAQMSYSPFYVGAGAGSGHLDRTATDLQGLTNGFLDNSDTTYTFRAGWRFNPYMAIEAGYYDLGKYKFNGTVPGTSAVISGEFKAKAVGVSLVGILPIDQFDLYARIGFVNSENKANVSTNVAFLPTFDGKDHQNGTTYGAGGRWEFVPHWAVFAEWMKNDKIRVDSYLIGIDYKF